MDYVCPQLLRVISTHSAKKIHCGIGRQGIADTGATDSLIVLLLTRKRLPRNYTMRAQVCVPLVMGKRSYSSKEVRGDRGTARLFLQEDISEEFYASFENSEARPGLHTSLILRTVYE